MTHRRRAMDNGEDIASLHEIQCPLESCTELSTEVVLEVALGANVLDVSAIPIGKDQSLLRRDMMTTRTAAHASPP